MELGICDHSGRIYGGRIQNSELLSPQPVVSSCKIVFDKSDFSEGPDTGKFCAPFVFREIFFDSKSRIRRGTIYKAYGSQPQTWRAQNQAVYGNFNTYSSHSIWHEIRRDNHRNIYVLLGDERRFTIWRLIDLECTIGGEEMVTIKSLSSFGLLPELLENEIPESDFAFIKERLNQIIDETYTASAESVVDSCREAATAILGTFLNERSKDLGALVRLVGDKPYERSVVQNAAGIINRFHPRRKTAEIRGKNLRRIVEDDAQLAVQLIGAILVELEWARW